MPRRLSDVGSRVLPSHRGRLGACPDSEGMRRLCARTIPLVTDSPSERLGLPDHNAWVLGEGGQVQYQAFDSIDKGWMDSFTPFTETRPPLGMSSSEKGGT